MSAFDDYLKGKGTTSQTVPTTPAPITPTPVAGGSSPFDIALKNKSVSGKVNPTPFDEAIKNQPTAAGNTLRWAGKQLMKPVSTVAVTSEDIGNAIGNRDWSYIQNIPKDVWGIVSGAKERSYTDIMKEHLADHPTAATLIGTGLDIVADPLNLVGGLTKFGQLAELVSKADKAGEIITADSKLMKEISKAGTTIEELRKTPLAATKAEQARLGQRSVLNFLEKPIVPAKVSEAYYKGTQAVGDVIKSIPIGTKAVEGGRGALRIGDVVEKGRSLFNTTTGNAAADAVLKKAISLNEYGVTKAMDTAKGIQKTIEKLTPEEIRQFSAYIEKEIQPTLPVVKQVGDELKNLYKKMNTIEQQLGLDHGVITNYLPHINVPEKVSAIEKVKNVFGSKQWSTKLGAAENRDVQKFVSEKGKELIGTAKSLGLERVDKVKGLSHDLNWGQFKSMEDVSNTLKKWGYKLIFKPQETLRGKYLGYFSPHEKAIVIASRQPTLSNVLSTLFHEIVHGAHFQLAGNIEMMETFSKMGKFKELRAVLESAKDTVRKDWVEILRANGISPETFAKLSKSKQAYYKEPTELLARVAQTYMDNPERARMLFPESVAKLEELRKTNSFFDILNTKVPQLGEKVVGDVYKKGGELFQVARGKEGLGITEHNLAAEAAKLPFRFEENPAVQFAYRAISHVKATNAKQLFEDMKQFAVPEGGIEVTAPELAGFKFEPGVAKQIDAYHKAIQPEEINALFKTFDKMQNWWKAQALLSPGYHSRNAIGNLWNNHLAGVGPTAYVDALKVQNGKPFELVTDLGKKLSSEQILKEAEKSGVINQGWFSKDITEEVLGGLKPGNFNPFSQENKLFRANKAVGSAIENNARLANFITQLKKGMPIDQAALEVKKYLFDYNDLTFFEKNVLKRIMPFYTFTRKNVPLQLENLMKQPIKYANLEKAVRAMESIGMQGQPPANEKYISDYIKSNTAMRVNYDAADKSYNYFLLGNWLPAYQAMDFMAQPTDNLLQMVTPFLKTPFEQAFNKSSFFKNTLGEAQDIERFPGEQVNFLGLNVTKKTATLLRNIRILNDLDKLNPGQIFGGKKGTPSIWTKAGLPAVSVPGLGNVSPSLFKYTPTGENPNLGERLTGYATGKTASYKPISAREYYNQDTDKQVQNYVTAIKNAAKAGDKARVKLITQQMNAFKKARGR